MIGTVLSLTQRKPYTDVKSPSKIADAINQLPQRHRSGTLRMFGDWFGRPMNQRELEQADVHYREALAVDPKHCGANHALGRDAVLLKKYQDAIPVSQCGK